MKKLFYKINKLWCELAETRGTLSQSNPAFPWSSQTQMHQVKLGGQIRQNFRLQSKHTAVPGLSQALLRKSTHSKKKKKENLITDHDNKQAAKKPLQKPFKAAQKYTTLSSSHCIAPYTGLSYPNFSSINRFCTKASAFIQNWPLLLQTIDNSTNSTSYQCLIWKTSLDRIQTFSKFISRNTEAKFGKFHTIPFQLISLRWDQAAVWILLMNNQRKKITRQKRTKGQIFKVGWQHCWKTFYLKLRNTLRKHSPSFLCKNHIVL